MILPNRLKLPVSFSPPKLRAALEELESTAWIASFVTQNYEENWDLLPLRGPQGAQHPVMMAYSDPACDAFEDTPFLKEGSYFRQVLEAFPFELYSVRLMGLTPGSRIKEHTDLDLSPELGAVRLHIPVRTNEDVEFYLNDVRVHMREGECWYLRLSDPHRVYNGGDETRIHLVVDAPATPAVLEFLSQGV
jgi:hypothetical protein